MPIASAQGGAIPNGVVYTQAQRADAIAAINQLQLADVWRGGNTIANSGAVRIDSQGNNAAGRANLQAQLNGVQGASTIACVLVDASVGAAGGQAVAAQQLYAIRQIKGALQNSLTNGTVYTLTGNPT